LTSPALALKLDPARAASGETTVCVHERKADAMKILLPVDGSPLALEAVHHAIRLVRDGLQASFVLANVQEPSSLYEVVVLHNADALQRMALEAGEDSDGTGRQLLADAGIEHESEIASGDPAPHADRCRRALPVQRDHHGRARRGEGGAALARSRRPCCAARRFRS
jgi:hypothetical protein